MWKRDRAVSQHQLHEARGDGFFAAFAEPPVRQDFPRKYPGKLLCAQKLHAIMA